MHGIIGMAKVYDRKSKDLPINSIVADAIVDDPLEHGARLKVLRSVRDDPLAGMHARGQIDDAMLAAGREWQRHYEAAQVGSVSAIDPTREAVDGGKTPEPITDRQIRAFRALRASYREIGQDRSALVHDILGDRLSISASAEKRGMTSGREICALSDKFKDSLEILAKLWGYAQ